MKLVELIQTIDGKFHKNECKAIDDVFETTCDKVSDLMIDWSVVPSIVSEELKLPIPLPDGDLTEYPYGWIFVRDIGFFEVDSIGMHEWIMAEIELLISSIEHDKLEPFNSGYYSEKLLSREGVAYMSSTSRYIFTGKLKNLNSEEYVRFTRDTEVMELF